MLTPSEIEDANAQLSKAASAARAEVKKYMITRTQFGYASKHITTKNREYMREFVNSSWFGFSGAFEGAFENLFMQIGTIMDYMESGEEAVLAAASAYEQSKWDRSGDDANSD